MSIEIESKEVDVRQIDHAVLETADGVRGPDQVDEGAPRPAQG